MAIKVKVEPDMLAAMESVKEIIADHLLRYSEWLDSEKLMKKPKKSDGRTHEDLAQEFLGGLG